MPKWIRVRNTITGHHQSVQVLLPEHEVLDQPAVNANGDPLPAKHNVPVKKAVAKKSAARPRARRTTTTKKAAPAETKEIKS